ncbi:hypothetical protein NUW58_g10091 [Xylaria curta]|uniref:Uncharacterized protein n=1 Tax=Xylaria curta TaxID=42375 RepID=A0ACC1MR38_9PEZI|nr:hypothetical protein NUW58_g10091 [Xylaria curta]
MAGFGGPFPDVSSKLCLSSYPLSTPVVHGIQKVAQFKMKATTALLSLLPIVLAADEPCIADCHCSDNCPRVASADFVLGGDNRVATAPPAATATTTA